MNQNNKYKKGAGGNRSNEAPNEKGPSGDYPVGGRLGGFG